MLLPGYGRDARLAPTLACAGLGGRCRDREPRRSVGSSHGRNTRSVPTLTCAGLGGCCGDGSRGGERPRCYRAMTGLSLIHI